ncbi:MAG: FGGY family carbohydrate kinase [Clostridia bacterium]|nr:FGGY family carbohydrate kinase [Clostridia bacterium]
MSCDAALAFDLGASSGKLLLGRLENGRAYFTQIHRFAHEILSVQGRLYWDFFGIVREFEAGYARAQQETGSRVATLAVDSFCNDYALLSARGAMLESPRCYRDARTAGWVRRAERLMAKAEVYRRTGQQFARFETCYHLLAAYEQEPEMMEAARELVFLPDYLAHLFGARKYSEYTVASVSNLYNIRREEWDGDILSAYGIRPSLLLPVVKPGTLVGAVSGELCARLRTAPANIYAVGSHDTACAVAAAPVAETGPFLFISSGTWSLVGAELDEPILSERSLREGFGNEGGIGGKIRYIRNVMGLWIIQECVRCWRLAGREYSFEELARGAWELPFIDAYIDPDQERFFEPKDMPSEVAGACGGKGRADLELIRIVMQSLACKYRYVIEKLEKLTERRYGRIYLLGGGSQNSFLNQLTADITGKSVLAGPADAAGVGNILTQWIGAGVVRDLPAAREICRRSCDVREFAPSGDEQEHYRSFLRQCGL